ncbi:MAG: hypothetical protein PHX51_07790 [Clostridia bacterium]|nr:hypothetical protein [Clostridia bacterium]
MDKKEVSIKHYCQEAKKRLSSGFWSDYRERRQNLSKVAATEGLEAQKEMNREKIALTHQIYDRDKYNEEEAFYRRVCDIIESEDVVLNPIMMLADKNKLQTLSQKSKQSYLLELSGKYQDMCKRYEREKRESKECDNNGFFPE